jgi:hypothetical protein
MVAQPMGVLITKKINPLARVLADISSIIFVWGCCVILAYTTKYEKQEY